MTSRKREEGRDGERRNLLAFISYSSNYENIFQQPSMKSCHLVLSDRKRERGEGGEWWREEEREEETDRLEKIETIDRWSLSWALSFSPIRETWTVCSHCWGIYTLISTYCTWFTVSDTCWRLSSNLLKWTPFIHANADKNLFFYYTFSKL